MQQHRTVIESNKDGSQVVVTREARIGIAGTSKDRRKQQRQGVQETWRTIDRVTAVSVDKVPEKAQAWPGLTDVQPFPDGDFIAQLNEDKAVFYTRQATKAVMKIEAQARAFEIGPFTVRPVLFGEPVEVSSVTEA
jgi:hypothetical protein